MKNLTRFLLFGGTLILLIMLMLPFQSHAQEVSQAISTGFFSKVGSWVKSNAVEMGVVMAGTLLAKGGWTLLIKKFANRGAIVMKELGEFCGDTSTFLYILDNAIKEDGSIQQNSVQEVLNAGREVIGELKDVTISIKPKT